MKRSLCILLLLLLAAACDRRSDDCTAISLLQSFPSTRHYRETWLIDFGSDAEASHKEDAAKRLENDVRRAENAARREENRRKRLAQGKGPAPSEHDPQAGRPGQQRRKRLPRVARFFEGEGWSAGLLLDGDTIAWNSAPAANLIVWRFGDAPLQLRFRCSPAPGLEKATVSIELNQQHVASLSLKPGFNTYVFPVPASMLARGGNRLDFHYGAAPAPPPDGHIVAWDWMELIEAGAKPQEENDARRRGNAIDIPFRSMISNSLPVLPGDELLLRLGFDVEQEPGKASLTVDVTCNGAKKSWNVAADGREVRLALPIPSPGKIDLRLISGPRPAGLKAAAAIRILDGRVVRHCPPQRR